MPQYGRFRFGRIAKYGRYKLVTPMTKAIGPHVIYRMRFIASSLERSDYITMYKERVILPPVGEVKRVRVKSNNGEWVYTQADEIKADSYKVRIRSISSDGGTSEWVYCDRANLQYLGV